MNFNAELYKFFAYKKANFLNILDIFTFNFKHSNITANFYEKKVLYVRNSRLYRQK